MTPELLLTAVLLAAAGSGAFVVLTGWLADQAKRRVGPPATGAEPRRGLYELAYLAGGPRRTVNTALVVMASRPHPAIRVASLRVELAAGATAPPEPIEQAVMDALAAGPRSGRRYVDDLRRDVATSEAMTGLRRRLWELGLLATRPMLARMRVWLRIRQLGSLVALPSLPMFVVAAATAEPPHSFAPTFFGIWLAIFGSITGLVGMVTSQERIRSSDHVLTIAGTVTLASARQHRMEYRDTPAEAKHVALGGVRALSDSPLRSALSHQDPLPAGRRPSTHYPTGWMVDSEVRDNGGGGGGDGGGDGGGGDGGGGGGGNGGGGGG